MTKESLIEKLLEIRSQHLKPAKTLPTSWDQGVVAGLNSAIAIIKGDASTSTKEGVTSPATNPCEGVHSREAGHGDEGENPSRRVDSSEISVLSDQAMYDVEAHWNEATPEMRLAWYNGMAKRTCPPMAHWRGILELANHFAKPEPVAVSLQEIENIMRDVYVYNKDSGSRFFDVDGAIRELGCYFQQKGVQYAD